MSHAQSVIPITIHKLKRVRMRLPPPHLFEELLGFYGNQRFFALWWSRTDQAPTMNDGILEFVGMPGPYRVWRYHPAVMPVLARYNIGDAAITADHWLLIDRKSRALYAGKVWDIQDILDYQKRGSDASSSVEIDNKVGCRDAPGERLEEPTISDLKLLNELEKWLDANMIADLR